MTRVLVLWCPDWPVVAAGADAGTPAAVVAGGRVTACTAAAREEGVRRGQRVRDAQRHCPGLLVSEEDLAAQARLFEPVVTVVESLCPRVEVVRPGLVAVPARGPARFYGGEQVVADRVCDAVTAVVTAVGYECAVGVADGSFAAALAAREPPVGLVVPAGETAAFLAPQPVSALERPELTSLLVRLGIRTLGGFAALPERDVLARFGPGAAMAHRLARGLEARPPATRRSGEDLAAVMPFDPPSDAEPVVFAARTLADQLHENLAAHGLACVRVEVEVTTSDGRTRSRLWRHDGLLSSAALAERVRWQLDAWRSTSPGSPEALTGGVTLLRLAPDQVVTDGGRQLALWGREAWSDRVDRAASRIQVLLGHAGVTRPVLAGGRGPGEQVVRVPWGDRVESRPGQRAGQPWPGRVPSPAPAVVYPEPLPAVVTDAGGRMVTVSGRCVVSAAPAWLDVRGAGAAAITGWTGPWPAFEQWWDAAAARRRARFQVTTGDGRAWLLMVDAGRWLVEAAYD